MICRAPAICGRVPSAANASQHGINGTLAAGSRSKNCHLGHLVLARRRRELFFRRITSYSTRNCVHEFRLESMDDISETFIDCLSEAYEVGEQKHLGG